MIFRDDKNEDCVSYNAHGAFGGAPCGAGCGASYEARCDAGRGTKCGAGYGAFLRSCQKKVFLVLIAIAFFFVPLYGQENAPVTTSVKNDSVTAAEGTTSAGGSDADLQEADDEDDDDDTEETDDDVVIVPATPKEPSVVKIISARKTEYKKDPVDDSELILFTGDVSLSVTQGSSELTIEADTVTFNRTKSLLYAEGSVKFGTKGGSSSSSGAEQMSASALLLNTETQEGFFDDGKVIQGSSDAINLSSGTKLIISSDLFVKGNANTVTFKDGTLTFCDDEDPHWKIKASRIWLLPGNEFGFLNALLYVGHIPVMYFPFFYYPKDEMIFNPVFSYDERRGYSIQTTTYIIGRKKLGSASSDTEISNFLKPTELKKQVREGLFYRNLEEKDTAPSSFLKVMVDAYSNLGFLTGVQGSFKPSEMISDISFSAFLGWSRTIFTASEGKYTTFYNDEKYSDHSWIFGLKLPFRFSADFSMKFKYTPFSLSISLPVYSDPYFKSDFLNRSEDMDWIDFLLNNPALHTSSSSSTTSSSVSSFSWSLTGNISTPDFVKLLNPYVKTLSITELSSKINFNQKTNATLQTPFSTVSPERSFYYPSSFYPIKITASIEGSFIPDKNKATTAETPKSDTNYILPDELDDSRKNEDASEESDVDAETEQKPEDVPDYMLKSMGNASFERKTVQNTTYSLTYSLKPSLSTESHFSAKEFAVPEDVKFTENDTFFVSFTSPLTVNGSASWGNGILSVTDNLSFSPVYKGHPVISDTEYPAESNSRNNLLLSDYKARKLDLNNSSSVSFKPFTSIDLLSGSSLSWKGSMKILRTEFTGTASEPEWDYKLPDWDEESITQNSLNLDMAASELANTFSQTLSLNLNLPPVLGSIGWSLSMKAPYCDSFSLSSSYKKDSKTSEEWTFAPLSQSSKWSFFDKALSVSQSFIYNIEEEHASSFSIGLTWKKLQFNFNMNHSFPYTFDEDQGWVKGDEKTFQAENMNLSYSWNDASFYAWKNRISIKPSVSTKLTMNLVRPTESSFSINGSLSFKINEVLDLTFSAESRNSSIFKYVQGLSSINAEIPGEKNLFVDLFDSFAFWDEDLRKKSAFKLQTLSLKVTHELHDWKLSAEFSVSPRLMKDTKPYYFDFSPYFKLSVVWKPLSSMTTTIVDDHGKFILNPEK